MRYQEARIQELPDQVPIGHIPRAMTVHCRGGLTRMCSPGEKDREGERERKEGDRETQRDRKKRESQERQRVVVD